MHHDDPHHHDPHHHEPPHHEEHHHHGHHERSGCFVATAAWDSSAGEVELLRRYRDTVLLATRRGRGFVRLYYVLGPLPARLISRQANARRAARALLRPVVRHAHRRLGGADAEPRD